MKNKKIKKIFYSFYILIIIFTISIANINANQIHYHVIPGGESLGLKLNTGVYIVGKYEVLTNLGKVSPWKESNIKENDLLIAIDNKKVSNNIELLNILKNLNNETELILKRDQQIIKTKIKIVDTKNNEKSLGLYIKDKIIGIGTLTFIDPKTNKFASLGHGIYENNELIENKNGFVVDSKINSIKKAIPGLSGEKRASILKEDLGVISLCSKTGIYGKFNQIDKFKKDLIQTSRQDEIKKGTAYFYTVISDKKVEKFKIEITDITMQSESSPKGIKFKVVDSNLIKETGGVVQGMSGSPIIQDGKLIGAVSHVNVENPLIGYGIHIEWMIKDLESVVA